MSTEIKVPEMGESVLEATVARWLKQAGDSVAAGEAVVELETDKVALEVSAQQNGVLLQILKQPGDSVMVGDTLALVGSAGAPDPRPATAAATPVAQRMAQDLGINLAQVQPGAAGKITKEDVQAYIEKTSSNVTKTANPPEAVSSAPQQTSPAQQPVQPPPASGLEQPGREKRIRMTRRRQTIARRLVEAQHTAAMLTTFNEVDMSAIIDIRKRRREGFKERYGVDLGFMPFFVKASIGALQAYPYLNAEISSSPLGDEIVLKSYYDIGIAIGAEEGLVVPVLRDADRMSFAAIEKAIREYAARAKEGTLTLEDLRGGTFTITNGGVFGSLLSTPILNPPQVAILGMHKIQERPVVVKGEIVIRPMMYLAVSYDHRIVDGREAVQFLARIKELVEDPEALLLG